MKQVRITVVANGRLSFAMREPIRFRISAAAVGAVKLFDIQAVSAGVANGETSFAEIDSGAAFSVECSEAVARAIVAALDNCSRNLASSLGVVVDCANTIVAIRTQLASGD